MQVRSFLMVAAAAILVSTAAFGQSASDTVFQIHPFTNMPATNGVINVTNSGASIGGNFAVNSGSGPFAFSATTVGFAATSQVSYQLIPYGNICVNLYAFSADEQLQSCCSCNLSPNALGSWDVFNDVDSNNLTGARPKDLVIKLVASAWNGSLHGRDASGVTTFTSIGAPGAGGTALQGGIAASPCNPAIAGQPITLFNIGFPVNNTAAQGQVPQSVLVPGMVAYARTQILPGGFIGGTESPFEPATLSMGAGTVFAGEPTPRKELDQLTALCAFNQFNGSGTGVCKTCRVGGL